MTGYTIQKQMGKGGASETQMTGYKIRNGGKGRNFRNENDMT
jgi:hypothetical protein